MVCVCRYPSNSYQSPICDAAVCLTLVGYRPLHSPVCVLFDPSTEKSPSYKRRVMVVVVGVEVAVGGSTVPLTSKVDAFPHRSIASLQSSSHCHPFFTFRSAGFSPISGTVSQWRTRSNRPLHNRDLGFRFLSFPHLGLHALTPYFVSVLSQPGYLTFTPSTHNPTVRIVAPDIVPTGPSLP